MAKSKLNKEQKAEVEAGALLDQIDASLEPHVLTDKAKTKIVGCRICKRPCVVTYFASAPKTACLEHRDRHAKVEVVREIKSDLEPHVLTDKEETKEVPCRVCGRPCVVTLFASAPKVACLEHRKASLRPTKTTEFKDDGTGRMVATTATHIVNEHDLEWSEWTLSQPWHFDRIWADEERAEADEAKAAKLDASRKIQAGRKDLAAMRQTLDGAPDLTVAERALANAEESKDDKKIGVKRKDLDRIKALEAGIVGLEQDEVELRETIRLNEEKANRLARIAYFRGAYTAGYRIEENVGHNRRLIGRESDIPIPADFLDTAGYHIATKKIPVAA